MGTAGLHFGHVAAAAGSAEELAGVPAGSSDSSSDSDYDEQLAQKMKQRGSFTGQVLFTMFLMPHRSCVVCIPFQHSLDRLK